MLAPQDSTLIYHCYSNSFHLSQHIHPYSWPHSTRSHTYRSQGHHLLCPLADFLQPTLHNLHRFHIVNCPQHTDQLPYNISLGKCALHHTLHRFHMYRPLGIEVYHSPQDKSVLKSQHRLRHLKDLSEHSQHKLLFLDYRMLHMLDTFLWRMLPQHILHNDFRLVLHHSRKQQHIDLPPLFSNVKNNKDIYPISYPPSKFLGHAHGCRNHATLVYHHILKRCLLPSFRLVTTRLLSIPI